MHGLPRKLSAEKLVRLFERRTRLVERLARRRNPLGAPQALLRDVPEDELIEALDAHPRIGARTVSGISAREQGAREEEDPAILNELARLNRAYEGTFGFRFVVFVNRRSKTEILQVLRRRLARTRAEELRTGVTDLMAIAADRYRTRAGAGR